LAVLDIDSIRRSAFDQEDVDGLERVMRWFARESRG
jgi:putative methionine-R-sulfoxide reductase with GAF domain